MHDALRIKPLVQSLNPWRFSFTPRFSGVFATETQDGAVLTASARYGVLAERANF
jgi:hypothetical protein